MVLGAAGDWRTRSSAFREALTRDPRNAQYAYNAGLALMRQGRPRRRAPLYAEALRRAPALRAGPAAAGRARALG